MNFFVWIRESVRQAVLLGVSDAMEQIGAPAEGDPAHQRLLHSLRQHATLEAKAEVPTTGRKRLGKSLDQIQAQGRPA